MSPNGKLPERTENVIKELHNHIRHIMQLLITWFTFFVTTTVVIIGLLFQALENIKTDRRLLWLVAIIFIVLSGLGAYAACLIGKEIEWKSRIVNHYENLSPDKDSGQFVHTEPDQNIALGSIESVPAKLYSDVIRLIKLVLILMLVLWVAVPILF